MTYTPKRGFFPVGIVTSDNVVSPSSGSISLDEIWTSAGLYGTSATASGLAISETQSSYESGLGPYLSSGPTSSGGLGSDMAARIGSRAYGGTMGGAELSSQSMAIYYENYDTDRVLSNGYVVAFGGFG
jgi:hypothetical protein